MTPVTLRVIALSALIIAIIALLVAIFEPGNAAAGIGPNGFAQYARQGIINENNHVYGTGNSPWIVTCYDSPNYQKVTDIVTCYIRERR